MKWAWERKDSSKEKAEGKEEKSSFRERLEGLSLGEEKEEEELEEVEEPKERIEEETGELGWVAELDSMIIDKRIEKEIDRFCRKYDLSRDNLRSEETSDFPYVNLEYEVPVLKGRRTVKILNTTFSGEVVNDVDFDGEAKDVADALVDIFEGEKKILVRNETACLLVEVDGDIFEVAFKEV